MKQAYFLGVDIGTSSVKAVIFNEQLNVITEHAIDYPLQIFRTRKPIVFRHGMIVRSVKG